MQNRTKQISGIVTIAIVLIVAVVLFVAGFDKNDDQNWQIIQSVGGNVEVNDRAGWYAKWGASVWTWPRATQQYFSESPEEGGSRDESIRVTFNDGGKAKISSMIRVQLPITDKDRMKLHRDFNGKPENLVQAVRSHLVNCMKATAPLMSASENQSARKAEFTQLVSDQLTSGLYQMKKVERILKDRTDEKGDPITVYATEIVYEEDADGNRTKPKVAQK